ncbi:MAG TPA: hypothetical protein PLI18_04570 [Pirellulaceae bacterium]|nr:hypothetical protein [Pirellulaceae bacterium]
MTEPEPLPANQLPYEQAYYPPVPTWFTRYRRNSLIWQLFRFAVINLKMMILLRKSH